MTARQKINRREFLSDLESVKAGTGAKEGIPQSSCFVFQDGVVMTFNGEIACQRPTGTRITGAFPVARLLGILRKLNERNFEVRETNVDLEFVGKERGFTILKQPKIGLPMQRVELPQSWKPLGRELGEAIAMALLCVGKETSLIPLQKNQLQCIHLHPTFIEATDGSQAIRLQTRTGLPKAVMIHWKNARHIPAMAPEEVALTKHWIHFRNAAGFIFSTKIVLKAADGKVIKYPKLDRILKTSAGHRIKLPASFLPQLETAKVFENESQSLEIKLSKGKISVQSKGHAGRYDGTEWLDHYNGPDIGFIQGPQHLMFLFKKMTEGYVAKDFLKVKGFNWEYVLKLGTPVKVEELPNPKSNTKPKKKAASK